MIRFDNIESALLKLNRLSWKNPGGGSQSAGRFNLARFDYAPVQTLSTQAAIGLGFTAKQKELAVTLITKYAKQWKKRGYDVSNITIDMPTKVPLRVVDSAKQIDVDETDWRNAVC